MTAQNHDRPDVGFALLCRRRSSSAFGLDPAIMSSIGLKVPPPAVAVCLALLMWLASLLVPSSPVPWGFRLAVALGLAAIGQSISTTGIVSFRSARTTVSPFKPTASSSLVSSGIYRFTRNPMYVGLLITLLGWAAFLSSLSALVFVPPFVLYINRFQVEPEERALSSLFGAEYTAYKTRVRGWL